MIIYYSSRSKARSNKGNKGTVVDCKSNPSVNGSRWGVKTK